MALAELTEKRSDIGLPREMIQYVARRMMGMEIRGTLWGELWRTQCEG